MPLKVMAKVMVFERPDDVTVVAPIRHWLFCRVLVELTGFASDPVTLSHSSCMVPRVRS